MEVGHRPTIRRPVTQRGTGRGLTKTVPSTAQAQHHLYPGIPYANRGEVRSRRTASAQTDDLKSLPNGHAKIKNVTRASQLRIDLLKKDGKLTPDARNLGFKEFNLVNHFARTELERQKLREIFKDLPGL